MTHPIGRIAYYTTHIIDKKSVVLTEVHFLFTAPRSHPKPQQYRYSDQRLPTDLKAWFLIANFRVLVTQSIQWLHQIALMQ